MPRFGRHAILTIIAMLAIAACGPAALSPSTVPALPTGPPAARSPGPVAPASDVPVPLYGVLITAMRDPGNSFEVVVAIDLASGAMFRVPWYEADPALARDLAWAPDGASVAISRRVIVDSPDGEMAENRIDVYPIAASEPSIELSANAWAPTWSPDGRAIAARFQVSGDGGVVVVALDGTEVFRQLHAGFGGWAPDGRSFMLRLPGDGQLGLVDLADGTVESLGVYLGFRESVALDDGPDVVWAPDGGSFAFFGGTDPSGLNPTCRPCRYDLATRSFAPMAPGGPSGEVVPVVWARNGLIVIHGTEAEWSLARVTDDGRLVKLEDVRRVSRPALAPDGIHLAYMEVAADLSRIDLVTLSVVDGTRTVVPDGGWPWRMAPIWQPKPVPLPWASFARVEPTPPPSEPATFTLASRDAFDADVQIGGTCVPSADGVRLEGFVDPYSIQLQVLPDGSLAHLSIAGPGFAAIVGKGFEMRVPWVALTPGATVAAGHLAFADLPNANGPGTISGTLDWTCRL